MEPNVDIPQIKPETSEGEMNMVAGSEIPVISGGDGQKPAFAKLRRGKGKKFALGFLGVLLIIIVAVGLLVGLPLLGIYSKAKMVMDDGKAIKAAVDGQNITKVKESLDKLKKDMDSLKGSYNGLGWIRVVPFAGAYWNDGEAAIKGGGYGIETAQLVIDAAEPYADIIGFTGDASKKATSGEENAKNRIDFIVQTIEGVLPKIEVISQKASLAKAEFDKIDPNRYPETFRGMKVRETMRHGLSLVDEGTQMVSQSKPLLEVAPYMLGIDSPRTYLLIFQNDKELRATGGFFTAYSVMTVNSGKFHPVSSNDIYNLDKKYTPVVRAAEPVIKYLRGVYAISPNYRLRDMNFNPDFKETMELFLKEAKKAGLPTVDGVIAVDTHVVVKILDAIGQIGVPGFGNFSTKTEPKCNCPQVIYELESFADVEGPVVWDQNDPTKIIFAPANYYNRKEVVGPLLNSVLANAMGQPKDKLPALVQAGWESLTEKHVLFYMFDEKAQKGVESFNLAGRIKDYDGDYLHINDSNLGGRKSNLYARSEVSQEVKIGRDGSVEKTVVITYKNPQSQDGWLNSILPNWTRVYVPKGSALIDMEGFEDKAEPYEELGKTVFAGGFRLRPQGVAKITLKYKLPFKVKTDYKILIQKQPGTDMPLYTLSVGRQKEEIFLKMDQEFKFRI